MKKLLMIVLWLAWALPAAAQSPSTSWEGIYRVNGVNPNGGTYSGAVQIARSPEFNLLYELTWMLDAIPDQVAMTGIGYEHDGFLIVAGTSAPMLASYNKDGQGLWTAPHLSGPTCENLTRTHYETLEDALRPMIPDFEPVGDQI